MRLKQTKHHAHRISFSCVCFFFGEFAQKYKTKRKQKNVYIDFVSIAIQGFQGAIKIKKKK